MCLVVEIEGAPGSPTRPRHSHGTDEGCTSAWSRPPGDLQPTRPALQSWGHNALTLHPLKVKTKGIQCDSKMFCCGFKSISHPVLTDLMTDIATTILFMRNWSSQGLKTYQMSKVWPSCPFKTVTQ